VNTAVTECARCSGKAGAHFGFCFLAQAWERLMGETHPWAPPRREPERVDLDEEIPLPSEPTDTDDWLEWVNEQGEAAAWPELDYPEEDPDYQRPPAPTGIPGDPPDPDGVYEDYLVLAGHVESEADWMPHGLQSIEVAKTELPDGYLDDLVARQKPERTYNVSGLRRAHELQRQAQEDAAVQFVYDCTDTVPGGRVKLNDLHDRYVTWHQANDRPYISKDFLRALLDEMGLETAPGRMFGDRAAGRAPLLVHGVTLRREEPEPERVVVTQTKAKDKHALVGSKPGRELAQEWRALIEPLITEQGWAYEPCNGNGRGKPRLVTPDGKTVTLPSTPHPSGRALQNTRSFLKQNGAKL
jgi:hypothetical protein